MIRLRAAKRGTSALTKGGKAELKRLRALRAQGQPLVGENFLKRVYGSPAVRGKLWKLQYGKCCYCERHYEQKHSDVEHFRPKTEALRAPQTPPSEGYWWLAYDIDNLYFACPNCNRPKAGWFPLMSGSGLVPEQHPRAVAESPTLLEPRHDDIEAHLTFVRLPNGKYQIAPKNGSPRGAETIRILGLDRDDLSEFRNRHFIKHVKPILVQCKDGTAEERARAIKQAKQLAADDAEYALLARAVFSAAKIPF